MIIKFTDLPQIKPMIVAVWCGEGKPSNLNDYLNAFVIELNDLLLNGMIVNERKITIAIRCFIADTPARAFLKGVL